MKPLSHDIYSDRKPSLYRPDNGAPWPDYYVEDLERHVVFDWLGFYRPAIVGGLVAAVVILGAVAVKWWMTS